ncbi:MAG: hypothetical protein HY537_11580 [Deltaproteobacteria bacterium]|nr:hypothetical protein [Deltaproteobacteria bacterium]
MNNRRFTWFILMLAMVLVADVYAAPRSKKAAKKSTTSSDSSVAAPATTGPTTQSQTGSSSSETAAPSQQVPGTSAPTSAAPATTGETTAVTAPSAPGVTAVTVPAPTESGIIGSADLRPTYAGKSGTFTTENEFSLGYKFNKNFSLSYFQDVNTNVYNPTVGPDKGGLNMMADFGWLKAKLDNIWENKDMGLSFSHEARVYTPTEKESREAGFVTAVRNYLKLKQDFGSTVNVQLHEIPVVYAYTVPGKEGKDGTAANPIFENRIYLIPEIAFTPSLKLSVPVMLHMTRNRDYMVGAKNNNDWSFKLYAWPELAYSINPKVIVALAYRTENWLGSTPSGAAAGFEMSEGFKSGVAQASLQLSL